MPKQIEHSVQELERKLETLERGLELAGAGSICLAQDGSVIEIDRGGLALFDLQDSNPEELCGRKVDELVTILDGPETLRSILAAAEHPSANLTLHYRTAAGRERWALTNSLPACDTRTGGHAVQVVIRDITQLEMQSEALRENQRTLATLLSNLHGIAYRCANDSEFTMKFISEGIEELTGYKAEDLINNYQLSYASLIHPDDRPMVWERVQAAIAERRPFYITYRIITASGEERFVSERGRGVFDGYLHALEGVIQDITPQYKAQEELRSSEERFRSLTETINDLVWETDASGRFTYVSPRSLDILGYRPEEILGKTILDLMAPDVAKQIEPQLRSILGEGKPFKGFIKPVLHKNGSEVILQCNGVPIRDESGNLTGFRGSDRDITDSQNAQEALRESERFLNNVFNAIQGGINILDLDMRTIRANRWMEMMYPDRLPLEGKNCYEVYRCSDETCPLCPAVKAMEDKQPHTEIIPYPSRENQTGWLELTAYPLLDEHGNVTGAIEHVRDATDRVEAEKELKRQREEYEMMLNSMPAWICYKDRDSRIVRANRAGAEAAGLTVEEIIGKRTQDLWPTMGEKYVADDREVLATGKAREGIIEKMPLASGEIRYVRTDKIPHRDDSGSIIGVIVFSVDITNRMLAEEALRSSEERYRELFEYAHDLICTLNADTGLMTSANNAAVDLLSYQPDELVGRPLNLFVNESDLARVEDRIEAALAGQPGGIEAWCTRKDGTPVLLDLRMRAMPLPKAPSTVHIIAYDVTERRRATEAAERLSQLLQQRVKEKTASLEKANRDLRNIQAQLIQAESLAAVGQLAAGISHEINNPLSFVSNNLAVLHRDFEAVIEITRLFALAAAETDPEERRRLGNEARTKAEALNFDYVANNLQRVFGRTIEGTERIRKIVRDMLDFTRLGQAEWKQIDLNDAINTTLTVLSHQIRTKRIRIRKHYGVLPEIFCMPGRINQVILNILINAIEAVGNDGEITVTTRRRQEDVVATITDNGPGIPDNVRERIFDPFFSTKPRGSGLGLSISYSIIAEHNGSIQAANAPGGGAMFTIVLPVKPPRGTREP